MPAGALTGGTIAQPRSAAWALRWRATSKQTTAAAIAAFEALGPSGVGDGQPAVDGGVGGQPVRLVADGQREPAGEVGVGVGRAGGRGGAEHPEAGRSQLPQLDVVDDRQQEQRAGRGPHDLRVGRVDGVRGEHDRLGPGRLGRPQDGAEVARIGQADGDDDEAGVSQDLASRRAVAHDGQQRLWCLRGRHPLQDAGGQRRAGGAGEHPAGRRRALRHVDRLELVTRLHGDRGEGRALDHQRALLPARTAAPQEAPQSLDLRVGVGQSAQDAASRPPWAAATMALKARGSVTARSARTLRSTSIPAECSPAMNRL